MTIVYEELLTIINPTNKNQQNQSSAKSSKNLALDSR